MRISFDPIRFAPAMAALFRLWVKSMRYTVPKALDKIMERNREGERFVIALWHDELFPIAGYGCVYTTGLMGIVSESKDGQFVASVMEGLGQTTVRGSSSHGGVRALLEAKRVMERENRMAVFAVDGPRGPRHEPKDGVIFLAQRAKAKIVPIRAYTSRKKVFANAWDRFQLPWFFSRCELVFGEPYAVTTEKLNVDTLAVERKRLKETLDSLGEER